MPDANEYPRTIEETVDRLLTELSPEMKEKLRTATEDELIRYHFGLGLHIRNAYGLWASNQELLDSATARGAFVHPDNLSSLIIREAWARLQGKADSPE